jgi:hypothetical protein
MAPLEITLPRVTTVAACRWGHPGRTGNWWGTNDTCDVDDTPSRFATGWLRQVRTRGEREDGAVSGDEKHTCAHTAVPLDFPSPSSTLLLL